MRLLCVASVILIAGTATAQTPATAIDATLELNRSALAAQQRIDRLYDQRQQVLAEIIAVEQDGSSYALRNRELELQLAEARQHLVEIDADLRAVTDTQTGIVVLLDSMIGTLERFIELDLPFELDKRRAVIGRLRAGLVRADIDVTEKYQSVVSAYLNEVRFGHSNSVSRQRIETPLGSRMAEILRLGRTGLWFVTPDGTYAGRWDPVSRHWTDRDTDPREVINGIRVVRETGSPGMISLPIHLDIR